MTDEQVRNEVWLNCFVNQIDGYPFGHPARNKNFKPLILMFEHEDGSINREELVKSVTFTFTDEQKAKLLERP